MDYCRCIVIKAWPNKKANLSATKVPAQKGDTEASKRKAIPTTKLPDVRMKGIELIHKKYHQGPKMHLIIDFCRYSLLWASSVATYLEFDISVVIKMKNRTHFGCFLANCGPEPKGAEDPFYSHSGCPAGHLFYCCLLLLRVLNMQNMLLQTWAEVTMM